MKIWVSVLHNKKKIMFYRIANNLIELKGLQSEYLAHRLSAYLETDTHTVPDTTVTFKLNNDIIVPEGKEFKRLDFWYWLDRGDEGFTAVKQHSITRRTVARMDFDKSCNNVVIEYIDIDGLFIDVSTDRMLHQILGDAFSFCQTVKGNMLLHSAAASYKGQAILFSAPSGTGKSTHTSLWKKYYPDDVVLFNDDTPILTNISGEIFACGTPWSGKSEINENIILPLKSIVFLKQEKENSIRRLTTIESVIKLLEETRKPVFEDLMEKHINFINKVIETTPIFELSCNISKEAVDLVKNTIFTQD